MLLLKKQDIWTKHFCNHREKMFCSGGDQATSAQLSEMVLVKVKVKMVAADIDQEVKECALECFGNVFASLGDLPQLAQHVADCLPPFVDRLKNEVTRSTAIRALTAIGASDLRVPLDPILPQVCNQLASYLHQNSRSFRQQCLDAIVVVVRKYGATLDKDVHAKNLEAVCQYITDTDLYITDLCVQVIEQTLRSAPDPAALSGAYQATIAPILKVCRSPLLQGGAKESVLRCLAIFPNFAQVFDLNNLLQQLLDTHSLIDMQSQGQRDVVAILASAVAVVLVNAGPEVQQQYVSVFLDLLKAEGGSDTKSILDRELALLALGQCGKKLDLSGHHELCNCFLYNLESSSDEIRHAAAVAFGYATVGATSSFLQVLIENLSGQQDTNSKKRYLLLTSLREVLSLDDEGAREHLRPHVNSVLPTLSHYADHEDEGVRNVVSECLGHLLVHEPEIVTDALTPMFTSASWRSRATAVVQFLLNKLSRNDIDIRVSIRFAAARNYKGFAADSPLKKGLLACMKDDEINVRKASISSMNTIAVESKCANLFVEHVPYLIQCIWDDAQVRPDLIREVDLGPFKHKVDDGLPVRKIAFTGAQCLLTAYGASGSVDTSKMMDFVLLGMPDHEDVQSICCTILTELCNVDRSVVSSRLNELIEPFDRAIERSLKKIMAKQDVNRVMDSLRLYARALRVVACTFEDIERGGPFQEFLNRVTKDETFGALYEGFSSNKFD